MCNFRGFYLDLILSTHKIIWQIHNLLKPSFSSSFLKVDQFTLRAFQNRFLLSNKVVILKGLMGVVML